MRFRKKPIEVEAIQWFKNGDHPDDNCTIYKDLSLPPPHLFEGEGKIIRYYRHPSYKCFKCSFYMKQHGWIDTLEGSHIVCPGDWIITGVKGEYYPCKPDIFQLTYEKVNE